MNYPLYKPVSRFDLPIEVSLLAVVFFLPLSLEVSTFFLAAGSLAWVAKMILLRSWEIERLPFDYLLGILVVTGCFSIASSPDRFFSLYNYVHLMGRYVLLYYFVSHNLRSLALLKRVVAALLSSALLVALYGFYQYIFGVDISAFEWVDVNQFPDLKVRVFSTLQNPNLLAGFLVTVISLVIGLSLKLTNNDSRLSMLTLALVLAGCLILTYSRGAWLSLAIIIGAFGLFYDRRLLWLLLIGPAAMLCFSEVSSRVVSIFQPVDTSSTLRLALWHSTLAMIRDNPVSGIGWGAYWLVYPHYDYFIQNEGTVIFHAHNMYLHLAAETGLPGLGAFAAFMYFHARTAVSMLNKGCPEWVKGLLAGLAAAILGFAVSGLTDHILFSIQISMLAWLLFAVVAAIKHTIAIGFIKKRPALSRRKQFQWRNITIIK